jgi:two-component system phosphate regulon response regulator PhoB
MMNMMNATLQQKEQEDVGVSEVLIVEDDKHLSKLLAYNLKMEGFSCTIAGTGEEAIEIMDRQKVDLVLLDIMLPKKLDGWGVCKLMRANENLKSVPIVIITAKGEDADRVLGLELGANDYIVKPFNVRELVLRVKNLRAKHFPATKESDKLKAGIVTVDIPRYRVAVENKLITLTKMEFKLLVTLIQKKGRVQSREALLENVWDLDSETLTRTVDTHIKRLRQKLEKGGKYIETVHGMGYRFSEDVK